MSDVNIYRALRVCAGLSVKELSEMTGVSEIYLSELERGIKWNPSQSVLEKLARVHKTEVAMLTCFASKYNVDYRSVLLEGLWECRQRFG